LFPVGQRGARLIERQPAVPLLGLDICRSRLPSRAGAKCPTSSAIVCATAPVVIVAFIVGVLLPFVALMTLVATGWVD
jgi:hypothetical protein